MIERLHFETYIDPFAMDPFTYYLPKHFHDPLFDYYCSNYIPHLDRFQFGHHH
jgi:hypothetical protein